MHLNPPEPTFLSGPYTFHIRFYNKNRQKSRFWWVKAGCIERLIRAKMKVQMSVTKATFVFLGFTAFGVGFRVQRLRIRTVPE